MWACAALLAATVVASARGQAPEAWNMDQDFLIAAGLAAGVPLLIIFCMAAAACGYCCCLADRELAAAVAGRGSAHDPYGRGRSGSGSGGPARARAGSLQRAQFSVRQLHSDIASSSTPGPGTVTPPGSPGLRAASRASVRHLHDASGTGIRPLSLEQRKPLSAASTRKLGAISDW